MQRLTNNMKPQCFNGLKLETLVSLECGFSIVTSKEKSKKLNLSWSSWPAAPLVQAGEPDPPARGPGNDGAPPPRPRAAVEWSSTSGAVESNTAIESGWWFNLRARACVRVTPTLLSPWASVSLCFSSFTSSESTLTRSLESRSSWAKFTSRLVSKTHRSPFNRRTTLQYSLRVRWKLRLLGHKVVKMKQKWTEKSLSRSIRNYIHVGILEYTSLNLCATVMSLKAPLTGTPQQNYLSAPVGLDGGVLCVWFGHI